jgi:hypothetical protein
VWAKAKTSAMESATALETLTAMLSVSGWVSATLML